MLNQYFSLLVKFSFRVNSCNKWHHQNISRNIYILNIVLKLQNCISRTPWKWSTEHLASSRKIAESSTWSMEDFVFHPCLSTLVRIMIFWCKTSWENIQDSIRISSVWSAHLTVLYYWGKKLARHSRYWDHKLKSEYLKFLIQTCSFTDHLKALYINLFILSS